MVKKKEIANAQVRVYKSTREKLRKEAFKKHMTIAAYLEAVMSGKMF